MYAQISNLGQAIIFIFRKDRGYSPCKITFSTSFERPLSKLSENHIIKRYWTTELKLWPFKNALFNVRLYFHIATVR